MVPAKMVLQEVSESFDMLCVADVGLELVKFGAKNLFRFDRAEISLGTDLR